VGPFLWEAHHPAPKLQIAGTVGRAELDLGEGRITRQVNTEDGGRACVVDDRYVGKNGRPASFTVRWQFPPDSRVTELPGRRFTVNRNGAALSIQVDRHWAAAVIGEGLVSPAFRKVCSAPFLQLTAEPVRQESVAFRTTFLGSESA
jgi:hypothetical protein